MNSTIIMNCVNCDKYITDLRESCLVLEQNVKVISQIEKWISPQILTNTDNLCQACWNLAIEVIYIKNEPSDDTQPGKSQTENDTDPLKVKTETPSPSNEETETSQINNTFENDPLKVEPEDTDLNAERKEAELPNSEDQKKLKAQLPNSGYESEQNDSISEEESIPDDEWEQEGHQSISKDEIRLEFYLSHSEDEIKVEAELSYEETESHYISAKRKKLDTHVCSDVTTCSNIEEIKDHNYAKQKIITKASDDSHDAERNKALRKGCSVCGRSILRKRSSLISIENPTETQQLITELILASVTREVTVYDRICHRCYQKYDRRVKKKLTENLSNVVDSTPSTNAIDTNDIDKKQDQTNAVAQSDQNDPSLDSDPDWIPRTKLKTDNVLSETTTSEPKLQIHLPNYKRAPSTSSSCIFYQCKGGTRNTPKEDLRIRVLHDYNYYIPVHSRICSFHLISNDWDQLFHSPKSMSTFYSEQIEDIFYLLKKAKSQVNFDNILSVDDNLLQYLIGINKKKFIDLLNEVPEVKNIHRGVCGLVAVLIKHYRHESCTKIASVMNMPRTTIERLMTPVKEALTKRGDILEAYVSSKFYSYRPYTKQNK